MTTDHAVTTGLALAACVGMIVATAVFVFSMSPLLTGIVGALTLVKIRDSVQHHDV